jgi:hypothetical protein
LAAGLEGCRVGARCRTALLQLQEGDLLLHGKKTQRPECVTSSLTKPMNCSSTRLSTRWCNTRLQ